MGPEELTLRLSACDYDGAASLKAYRDGGALDDRFISRHAPSVKAAGGVFQTFINDISQGRQTQAASTS